MDTVMSLTTGIISGIVSGWLVTEYYRKVDKRKEEREKQGRRIYTYYSQRERMLAVERKNKKYI